MLTSRDPGFQRPDVAERLLTFHHHVVEGGFRDEAELLQASIEHRGAVWGAILTQIAHIQGALPTAQAPNARHRMADFWRFGWTAASITTGRPNDWVALMERLAAGQATFASEGDGVTAALRLVLERHGGQIHETPVGDLYQEARDIATTKGFLFPNSVQGFGRRFG